MSDSDIIERLGGTVRVAELCQVKPQAVTQWKRKGIPPARLQFLKVVRPDIFGPADQAAA